MEIKSLIALVIQLSLVLLVLAVGLQSRWQDVTFALRRPRLLVRGFIAVNIVVPVVAIVLLMMLPVLPMTKVGIAVMAVSPLAPFAPGKMLKTGAERSKVVGLYVALVLAAVVVVPATVALLSAIFPTNITVPVQAVAGFVFTSVLLPLLAGVLLGTLWPKLGERLAPVATIVAYVLLLPVVLLLLYMAGGQIVALIGNGALFAIVATVAAGLAAGHLLGGPELANRMALAQAAATRHPGIAGLIAHRHFDDQRVMLAVVLFLLTSIIVSAIYSTWAKKRAPEQPDADVVPTAT